MGIIVEADHIDMSVI